MRNFLMNEYPSKQFMPAIGVSTSTLHKWAARGYIDLGEPGTGKSVLLIGEKILYAAAINIISRSGGTPKEQILGLEEAIHVYADAWRKSLPHTPPATRYCVYKFVDHGAGGISNEWEISDCPTGPTIHIVEGHGDKAEPFHATIDLEELLRRLVLRIEGRSV